MPAAVGAPTVPWHRARPRGGTTGRSVAGDPASDVPTGDEHGWTTRPLSRRHRCQQSTRVARAEAPSAGYGPPELGEPAYALVSAESGWSGIEPPWRSRPAGARQRLGSCARSLRPLGAPPKRSFPGSPMGKRRAALAPEAREFLRAIENDASVWLPRRRPWLWRLIRLPARSRPSRSAEKGRGAGIHQESTGPLALGATSARPQIGGAAHGSQPWGVMSVSEGRPGHRCIRRHVDRQRRAWAVGQADCAVTRSGHR
jgi:hypothetical protein